LHNLVTGTMALYCQLSNQSDHSISSSKFLNMLLLADRSLISNSTGYIDFTLKIAREYVH